MADVRLTATNPEDSSVVPVACNAKGELLLEEPQEVVGPEGPQGPEGPPGPDGPPGPSFDGQLNAALNVQGSGDFTHTVTREGRQNVSSFVSRHGELNTFGRHYEAFNYGDGNPCFSVDFTGTVMSNGNQTSFLAIHPAGSTNPGLYIQRGSSETVNIKADGSAKFTDFVLCTDGSDLSALYKDGNAVFSQGIYLIDPNPIRYLSATGPHGTGAGDLWFGNHRIQTTAFYEIWLEPDNEDNYVSTLAEDGNETRVYNGPTLDVKEEILLIKAALAEVMGKLRMVPPAGWEVWDGSNENS